MDTKRANSRVWGEVATRASCSILLAVLILLSLATRGLAQVNPLHFLERTEIVEGTYLVGQDELPFFGEDASDFLGDPSFNFAATGSSAVGDVNQDGYPDIVEYSLDALSAPYFGTVVRINDQGAGFDATPLGTTTPAATIRAIALGDLDGDGFPDLIQAFEGSTTTRRVEVYFNSQSSPYFDLASPDFTAALTFCPTDIAVGNLNQGSALDFVVAQEKEIDCTQAPGQNSVTSIFYNDVAGGVAPLFYSDDLPTPTNVSTRGVVLVDANNDLLLDVVTVNQGEDSSQLFLNNGSSGIGIDNVAALTFTHEIQAYSGATADLNGDGFDDLVLSGRARPIGAAEFLQVMAYLNDGSSIASFTPLEIFNDSIHAQNILMDTQLGDIDEDGDIDVLIANFFPVEGQEVTGGGGVNTFLNDGAATPAFSSDLGGQNILQDPEFVAQRVEAELVDFDLDGDLDVYAIGGWMGVYTWMQNILPEGASVCDGCLPNQFFENLTIAPDGDGDGVADVADNCPAFVNAGQDDTDGDGIGDGCDSECDDGVDNDFDGSIDSADLDCTNGVDSELPACIDGGDNDFDGLTDYPDDPECSDPWGFAEHYVSPSCGLGFELVFLLPPLMVLRRRRLSRRDQGH